MLTIRKAALKDLAAITGIYNKAILHTTASFDTNIKTPEEQNYGLINTSLNTRFW